LVNVRCTAQDHPGRLYRSSPGRAVVASLSAGLPVDLPDRRRLNLDDFARWWRQGIIALQRLRSVRHPAKRGQRQITATARRWYERHTGTSSDRNMITTVTHRNRWSVVLTAWKRLGARLGPGESPITDVSAQPARSRLRLGLPLRPYGMLRAEGLPRATSAVIPKTSCAWNVPSCRLFVTVA